MKTVATAKQLEVLTIWRELGPNGQEIFLQLGRRLARGARQYGDFPIRHWKREAAEEALDLCVYLTAELALPSRKPPKKAKSSGVSKKSASRATR